VASPSTRIPRTANLATTCAGWIGICALLALQLLILVTFAQREIVWGYPTAFDQTVFLSKAYETYDYILKHSLASGLDYGLAMRIPQGNLLQLQASLAYLVLGPSRLSSILLNGLYFAMLQLGFVWVLRWLLRSWAIAFLAVGMLWTTTSRFTLYGGGITDFRLDFISICLFGIMICVAIRSDVFQRTRWALAVGGIAGYAVLFRYILIVYVLAIVFVWLLVVILERKTRSGNSLSYTRQQLRGLAAATVVFAAIVVPMLIYSKSTIYRYYILGHLGPDKKFRILESHTESFLDAVLFYPRSLVYDHLGALFLLLACAIVSVLLAVTLRSGKLIPSDERRPPASLRRVAVFLSVCFLAPFTILTLDVSKSPVVGGVLVMPLLWLFLILAIALSKRTVGIGGWIRYVLPVISGVAVFCGLLTEFQMAARRSPLSLGRADTDQVLKLYDVITAEAELHGWSHPRLAMDRMSEYLHSQLVPALVYERHGVILKPESMLGDTIFSVPEEAAIAALQRCDFAILTLEPNSLTSDERDYPFNRSMRRVESNLLEVANHYLVPRQRFHMSQQDLVLYVRPAPAVSGADSGWILERGLTLSVDTDMLRARPGIELRGSAMLQTPAGTYRDIDLPGVSARWQSSSGAGKPIEARIRRDGADYRIVLALNSAELPKDARSQIAISFDKNFIPKDLGLNGDTRRLVLPAPDEVSLLPRAGRMLQ
jgi:hypothetical protein